MCAPVRTAARVVLGVVVGLLLGLGVGPIASAHTGLDSSDPADGSTVEGPLEVVTLDFTGTPIAVEGGIIVADAAGNEFEPVEVLQEELRITARFDPPLGDGSYALAWVVRSDDTHTVDGSLRFAVTVPATTPAPTTTIPAETSPPNTEAPVTTDAAAAPATTAPPSTVPATTIATEETSAGAGDDGDDPALVPVPPVPPAAASADDGEAVARIGRLVTIPAAVVVIGLLLFAATAFTGSRGELATMLRVARLLAVLIVLGAVIELAGLHEVVGGDVVDVSSGRAVMARAVGGLLVVVGIATLASGRARSLSSAVAEVETGQTSVDVVSGWRPQGRDLVGVVGAAGVAVSFAFDGHQVSEGPRVVHAAASVVHVVAAAAWAGGLVGLAVLLRRRRGDAVAPSSVPVVLAFSVVATVALVVAGLAGGVMTWFIGGDPTGYGSTEWGRLLIVKLVLVAAAVVIGAYNHFRVRPALQAAPDDVELLATTRRTVTVEAALLVGAALVTAVLVGASIV